MEKIIILMVGCSGSGKSTKAIQHMNNVDNSVLVSADHFFEKDGKYIFDGGKLGQAHSSCQSKFLQYVKENRPLIIVDNTNTTARERDFYIKTGKQYGYKVMVDVLNTDIDTCASRNVHGVNKEIVNKQASRIDLKPGFYEI